MKKKPSLFLRCIFCFLCVFALFFSRFFRTFGCILLLLAVLAEGWLIYGVRLSAQPPVVREYTVGSDKISSPVTIVMLSDLHGCEHPTLTKQVAEIAPDLILLCGDMINHDHETGEEDEKIMFAKQHEILEKIGQKR